VEASPSVAKNVVFWGASGHARVLRECLAHEGFELAALFDNDPEIESPFIDVPVYRGSAGFEAWLRQQDDRELPGFLIAIGGDRGRDRIDLQMRLQTFGLTPLVARHPSAFIAETASIGLGSQVLARAAVCVDVHVGRTSIINTGATVDHQCDLGDGVHICPGAHLAGCVEVGDYAMIGTGAVVIPHVRIGEGAIVGAGAVVLVDVDPYTTVVGNPARLIRRRASLVG